ncbi:MAG: sigma-54-dependent Fis family transcriptional regulator [Deltaproteobacteria bacterium]|nr:sigma-54-dependent Fis family transcriptional regulator [Deltaproteobacteria bacterium]
MPRIRTAERAAVLVVEDEPENADLMLRALRKLCSVEICSDGVAAVDRVQGGRFLAVIADHHLPGLTGVEVLERVARLAPQTERILVSGHASAEVLTDAINRGHVGHFLPKPITVDQLVGLISRLIAQSTPEPAHRALLLVGPDVRETARSTLGSLALAHDVATDVPSARRLSPPQGGYELVLWDTAMVKDTMAGLSEITQVAPGAAHVCVERPGGDPDAPRLLAAGVDDVIWRPVRGDELAVRVRRVLDRRRLIAEAQRMRHGVGEHGLRELIGQSPAMTSIFDKIERVAATDATVLIRGETGTGKELVARVLHALSHRRDRPFVPVNCAALPETLVESELFGHERGAFTGATARRAGRFERADGGTLFIDEVGDVPPAVQVKLLRTLQERSFERLGGNDTLCVNFRLIAATNRDLERMIADGNFREDLFYRLNVVPIQMPPLRERTEDIWLLAERYLVDFQRRMGKEGIRISDRMRRALESHAWPGNIRELVNVIERVVALTPPHSHADVIEFQPVHHAPPSLGASSPPWSGSQRQARLGDGLLATSAEEEDRRGEPGTIGSKTRALKELVGEFERRLISEALERHKGSCSRAARELGITRQGLALKIAKHGLTLVR